MGEKNIRFLLAVRGPRKGPDRHSRRANGRRERGGGNDVDFAGKKEKKKGGAIIFLLGGRGERVVAGAEKGTLRRRQSLAI